MSQDSNLIDVEVLSYNTRGLGDERKRRKIFNYVKKHTSGKAIVLFQETYSTKKVKNLWKYQWHGDMIFSHGTSGARGVCSAFRYDLECKLLSPKIIDDEGWFIILHIEIQGNPYILINYYGPNSEPSQVKTIKQIASRLKDLEIEDNVQYILAGNWNLIFDRSLDAMGGSPSLKCNALKELKSIMIDYNLVDIWRARNPNLRQFTWRRSSPIKLRHLDFFLISDDMQYDVRNCKQLTAVQSDHSPIIIRISSISDEHPRGRGY